MVEGNLQEKEAAVNGNNIWAAGRRGTSWERGSRRGPNSIHYGEPLPNTQALVDSCLYLSFMC